MRLRGRPWAFTRTSLVKGSPRSKQEGRLGERKLGDKRSTFTPSATAEFHKHPDPQRKNIEQVWYTGRMMGETVALTITGERTAYDPGIWFNSAKFFDIEYQTYGWVRNNLQEGEADHYWEHPNGRSALHLVWNAESRVLHGVNSFGFRLRHEVFDRWLREKATVDHVVQHLHEAAFDPEFFERTEMAVRASFNQATSVIA
jgi:hypothetical protein